MEWSYVIGAVVFFFCVAMYIWPKPKIKSVTDTLLDEQDQTEEMEDPAKALGYEDVAPQRPTGISSDGWLAVYTMAIEPWYGHALFQTLSSYGFTTDEQQCLSYNTEQGDTLRVMKATEPMTFNMDLLAQQKVDGLVWLMDVQSENASETLDKLRELTTAFVLDMNAKIVSKDKEPLEQEWFDSLSLYLNTIKQAENA